MNVSAALRSTVQNSFEEIQWLQNYSRLWNAAWMNGYLKVSSDEIDLFEDRAVR